MGSATEPLRVSRATSVEEGMARGNCRDKKSRMI